MEENPEEEEAARQQAFEEKRNRLEYLRGEMERLKEELRLYRQQHFEYNEGYERLKNDLEYEFYLRDGGFPMREDGFRVKRIYPSLEEIFHERPPVVRDLDSIDWKALDNKVYIREFFEEEGLIEEPMTAEEAAEAAAGHSRLEEGLKRVGDQIKKVEIPPEIKRDFENLIGTDLTLRIGVLSILLSVIIGYNYLISEGYIPTWARVVVGACIGSAFFGLSYFLYLRKMSIVSLLVGAGIVSMYYTVYVALHNYGLFTPWQAFASASLITAGSVAFSLWYDKRELSVLAIFGGYVTPYLASKASDTYAAFLTYFLLLNLGMLAISYWKNWRSLHFIAFAATLVFMVSWIRGTPDDAYADLIGLFIFATLFHIVFYVMTVLFDLKDEIGFTDFDFYMALANTACYLYWGVHTLALLPEATLVHTGIFLLLVAALKGAYVWLLFDQPTIDGRLLDVQIGAVILLVNVSIYLIFEQNIYLNTLYVAESIAMLHLGVRMDNRILKTASAAMMLFALGAMTYGWYLTYRVYPPETVAPFINKGFWAGVITFGGILYTIHFLHNKYSDILLGFVPKVLYESILGGLLLIIGYLAFEFELMFQTRYVVGGSDFRTLLFFAYSLTYLLFVRWVLHQADIGKYRSMVGWLVAILVTVYTPWGYFLTSDLRDGFFDGHYPLYPFLTHYFNLGISIFLMYLLVSDIVRTDGYKSSYYSYAIQLACVLGVAQATVEYEHLFVLVKSYFSHLDVTQLVSQYRATSFTVLWTLLSLALMLLGMRMKIKDVRMMSLLLFGLTILKFFIVDFWRMEIVGKIVSFLVIGLLLVLVSMLYQNQLRLLIEQGELVLDRDATLTQQQADALARLLRQKQQQADMDQADGEGEPPPAPDASRVHEEVDEGEEEWGEEEEDWDEGGEWDGEEDWEEGEDGESAAR